ncbi:MAG TPA: Rieske 2Fe-2S domain-containing protein, partial [Dehalococcoidia bacterium]|nr:Rieske 2Fe-2S domain-containing protein [Dehalococcoidia bacterium]
MLTAEENDLLCRVGPGSPMGDLMRRYWQPIAAASELTDEQPVKPVRILGEDLALFRDLSDRLGLISLYCPHRLRPLTFGIPEEEGLRCPYTGWLFDVDGRCLDIPFEPEDSTLKYEVRATAYPAQELGGLVWAYLGPEPAPLLPPWDLLVAKNVFRQIGHAVLPCNWLQCMESVVDPIDNPYLHSSPGRLTLPTRGRQRSKPNLSGRRHVQSEFERNKYGVVQRCRLSSSPLPEVEGRNSSSPLPKGEGQSSSSPLPLEEGQSTSSPLPVGEGQGEGDWVEAHPLIFPVMVRSGSGFRQELQFRVPLDDTHTWNVRY